MTNRFKAIILSVLFLLSSFYIVDWDSLAEDRGSRPQEVEFKFRDHNMSRGPAATKGIDNLPRGVMIVSNIRAIKTDQYTEAHGEKVFVRYGLTYFYTSKFKDERSRPLAFDQKQRTYHMINNMIRIEGVNESGRQELRLKGIEEYHYNSFTKVYLHQASNLKLISTYQDLLDDGWEASLEFEQGIQPIRIN